MPVPRSRESPLRFCSRWVGLAGAVATALLVWASQSYGQEYSAQNWHTEDGLPDEEITAIEQTPDGYLWVGTPKGLARFDGQRFRLFKTESSPELRDARISNLLTDREGTLWIGTLDGNLVLRKGNRFEPVQPPVPLPLDRDKKRPPGSWLWGSHRELIADGEGSIWWQVTGRGIARLRAGSWTVFTATNGLPTGTIQQLVCDGKGRVWIAVNGRLHCFCDDRWNPIQSALPLSGAAAVLAPAAKGGLWVAETEVSWPVDGGQVRRLADREWQPPTLTIAPMHHPYWAGVSSLHEDRTGHLWVGSSAAGLCYFDAKGQWHELKPQTSLAQRFVSVSCLFEDHQGSIWVGTDSGLYRVTPHLLTMLPILTSGEQTYTTCATRDGAVWVGTETAGVFRFEEGKFKVVGGDWGTGTPQIFSLFQDSRTNLWAGTSRGLFWLQGSGFRRVAGSLQTNWISAIFEDRAGCMWFGTTSGLFSCHDRAFTAYAPPVDIRSIAEDGTGNLWIGTIGSGLFRLLPGKPRTLSRVTEFPTSDARALFCDQTGTLWVGGWGSGLFRRDKNAFQNFTTADGLASDRIISISNDNEGRLWLCSNNGIIGFAPEILQNYVRGQSHPLLWLRLSSAQGLANRLCSGWGQPALTRTSDGCLWVPNMEQMAVFDPAKIRSKSTGPSVLLEAVMADGKEMSFTPLETLRSASGTRRFEFHFTATDLLEPQALRFQYKLEGMDRDWVDAGNQRVAYYSQLPPGEYKFRVMVGEGYSQWHETAVPLRLEVLPRFWERRWIQILGATLLAASIGGSFMLKERRKLQRRWEWAEMQNAVEKERMRIARDIHDDLGSSLTHIALLSELAQSDFDQPKQAKAHIDEIFTTARRVTRSVDEIVWAIDPKNDSLEMSLAYIYNVAQENLRTGGINCRLELPETLPVRAFSSSVRHHLYLAVCEALNNIIKHAAASEVRLRVNVAADCLMVIIADNGRGFAIPDAASASPPPPAIRGGHGLRNMMHRLKAVGGRCELESQPGHGTVVRFVLPLEPPAKHT